ncbi:hypothetical protein [Dyella sp. 2HG41-7]|uniref:hypothetical protein n=1 Tax=Dyella sp. 2HG41-7 TaxID=2883239 RepID=UPI001F35201B|nr:hypothetical protein [Dyella sp. 2HG41-7]
MAVSIHDDVPRRRILGGRKRLQNRHQDFEFAWHCLGELDSELIDSGTGKLMAN